MSPVNRETEPVYKQQCTSNAVYTYVVVQEGHFTCHLAETVVWC